MLLRMEISLFYPEEVIAVLQETFRSHSLMCLMGQPGNGKESAAAYFFSGLYSSRLPTQAMNTNRSQHGAAVTTNNQLIIVGGLSTPDANPISTYEVYTTTDGFKTFSFSSSGSLLCPDGRYYTKAAGAGTEAWISYGGGSSSTTECNLVMKFAGSPTPVMSSPTFAGNIRRLGAAVTTLPPNKFMVAGGYNFATSTYPLIVEIYTTVNAPAPAAYVCPTTPPPTTTPVCVISSQRILFSYL